MHTYWLTINEVAAAIDRSRDTVKRALSSGRFPNARRRDDISRTWEIPIGDVIAAGYEVVGGNQAGASVAPTGLLEVQQPLDSDRIRGLELEAAVLRAVNQERSEHIVDLQLALSALSALANPDTRRTP